MLKLAIRRLLLLLLQMLILSFFVFFLMSSNTSFQDLTSSYWNWLVEVVTNGNFGWSWLFRMPTMAVISLRLSNTLRLLLVTLLLMYGIGIPLGIISGRSSGSWKDRTIQMGTQIGASFPSFTLAYILILYFALQLRWFPFRGSIPLGVVREGGLIPYYMARLHHVILPAFSLAIFQLIFPMKYLRNSIIDIEKQQFVTLARAKGVKRKHVFKKHIFKNSLSSLIASFPTQLMAIISGSIIIEGIFTFPGIGGLFFIAFFEGDSNVVKALVLVLALIIIMATFMSDILLMALDPRVKIES